MRVTELLREGILYPGLVRENKPLRKEVEQPKPTVKFMKKNTIMLRNMTKEELREK